MMWALPFLFMAAEEDAGEDRAVSAVGLLAAAASVVAAGRLVGGGASGSWTC